MFGGAYMGMMGMPTGGMGVPMGMPMPFGMGVPGVMPGVPGMGWYNSLPGRFGRDILGRDFAGPGGPGSTQPYRPPDPSALPPMPAGLPFIARPGQEGFDQYGRMIPPPVPEGWDGWGRPIVASGTQAHVQPAGPLPMPPGMQAAMAGVADPAAAGGGGPPPPGPGGDPLAPANTRDMPLTTARSGPTSSSYATSDTGRPDPPECFNRPPAKEDSFFRYDDFEAFSLHAKSLNRSWELYLPRALVSHDVSEADWTKFLNDLRREALSTSVPLKARQDFGKGPEPILSETVHSLLASWAVAFFSPRGISVYAARRGKRVVPPPVEPPSRFLRGYSRADEYSDDALSEDSGDESWWSEENEHRAEDAYLPRREREIRSRERVRAYRQKRRERKYDRIGAGKPKDGDWEVHFVCMTPTLWQPNARPRTYGEPWVLSRR